MTYISWQIDTLKSGEMAPCHQSSCGRWHFQLSQESGFTTRETGLSKMKLLFKLFSFTSCRTNFVETSATALLRKWLEFLSFALGCSVCVRVCVCVCVCVHACKCVCVCVCVHACKCVCVCVYGYVCVVCLCVCVRARAREFTVYCIALHQNVQKSLGAVSAPPPPLHHRPDLFSVFEV